MFEDIGYQQLGAPPQPAHRDVSAATFCHAQVRTLATNGERCLPSTSKKKHGCVSNLQDEFLGLTGASRVLGFSLIFLPDGLYREVRILLRTSRLAIVCDFARVAPVSFRLLRATECRQPLAALLIMPSLH